MADLKAADLLYAVALGDAVCLPYEGRYVTQCVDRLGSPLAAFPYRASCRDFPLNDWSDDTDQMVCLARALRETGGDRRFEVSFAKELLQWVDQGFPELGDEYGSGCGAHTHRVIKAPSFARDPLGTAAAAHIQSAGNGSLMRTAVAALAPRERNLAARQSAVTHPDPRCVGACVLLDEVLRLVPRHPARPSLVGILKAACARARPHFGAHWPEVLEWLAKAKTLDALSLDEREGRGYVLKTLAVGVWALKQICREPAGPPAASFKAIVCQIALRGGDADTNAAVACAVLGAHYRAGALPQDWLQHLPNLAWLTKEAEAVDAR